MKEELSQSGISKKDSVLSSVKAEDSTDLC